jgi:hypothetical protein
MFSKLCRREPKAKWFPWSDREFGELTESVKSTFRKVFLCIWLQHNNSFDCFFIGTAISPVGTQAEIVRHPVFRFLLNDANVAARETNGLGILNSSRSSVRIPCECRSRFSVPQQLDTGNSIPTHRSARRGECRSRTTALRSAVSSADLPPGGRRFQPGSTHPAIWTENRSV